MCIPKRQPGASAERTLAAPPSQAPPSHDLPTSRVSSSVSIPPFQALLDAHGYEIHRFLIAMVGRVEADDCYQETWLAALQGYPSLRDATNLRGWLMTIAHRKAIDHVRRKGSRAAPVAEAPEPQVVSADPNCDGLGDVWEMVRELPVKQRTAIALRYLLDAGYEEISSVMGTSEEAARRSVHEGLKRLRLEYSR